MAIWHEQRGNCFVIHLDESDLTEKIIDPMRQILTVAFLKKNYNLILDLTQCEMVDSYFVGLLISTHNDIRNLGGRLICVGAKGQIANAFEAIRLNQIIKLYDKLETALAECPADSPPAQ